MHLRNKILILFIPYFFGQTPLAESEDISFKNTLYSLDLPNIITNFNQKLKYAQEFDKSKAIYLEKLQPQQFIKDTIKNYVQLNGPNAYGINNITKDCYSQIFKLIMAVNKAELWALSVFDSFGKPSSGILEGSLIWAGEFGQCVNTTQSDWNGKYCVLAKPVDPTSMSPALSLKYGICIPDLCNNNDIAELINLVIDKLSKNTTNLLSSTFHDINSTYVTCQEPKPVDTRATIALVIIGILVALVLFGTICDIYKIMIEFYHKKYITTSIINDSDKEKLLKIYQEENESLLFKILTSFSAYTNTVKLFKVVNSADHLDCLNGIRFLSLCWVVLGHTYAFESSYIDNPLVLGDWLKRFSFMVISNAFFSVDSFFVMSGLLTSYLFLKEFNKTKKLTGGLIAKYYIHRFWRITPPYMLVLMISACLSKYFGKGPFYPKDGFELNYCKNSWWTNLLYINNLVKTDEMCLGVSWYLANDMQFHLISPIILIPLALGKKVLGIAICILLIIGNIIATSIIVNAHPGTENGILGQNTVDYFQKVYIPPWCRIGPYIVGLLAGYVIYLQKNNSRPKVKIGLDILFFLLSLFAMCLMLFGLYPEYNGNPINRIARIIYEGTSRIIWGTGLAYIMYSCITHGGIIDKLLSLKIWTPLSRLSFATYLIHSTIIYTYIGSQAHPFHIQDSNIIYTFIGHLFISYGFAYLISLVFEVPLLGLEKFIFKKH